MDKWLNRLGQVAMVAIAAAALVAVFRPQPNLAPRSVTGYEPGDKIDVRNMPLSGPALLIATRSTCGFCTESIPFWRTRSGVPIVWLAVGEDVSTNRKYLLANGLEANFVLALDEARVTKVTATPTLILIDKNGTVIKAWVGSLGSSAQDDVRSRLANLPNS